MEPWAVGLWDSGGVGLLRQKSGGDRESVGAAGMCCMIMGLWGCGTVGLCDGLRNCDTVGFCGWDHQVLPIGGVRNYRPFCTRHFVAAPGHRPAMGKYPGFNEYQGNRMPQGPIRSFGGAWGPGVGAVGP